MLNRDHWKNYLIHLGSPIYYLYDYYKSTRSTNYIYIYGHLFFSAVEGSLFQDRGKISIYIWKSKMCSTSVVLLKSIGMLFTCNFLYIDDHEMEIGIPNLEFRNHSMLCTSLYLYCVQNLSLVEDRFSNAEWSWDKIKRGEISWMKGIKNGDTSKTSCCHLSLLSCTHFRCSRECYSLVDLSSLDRFASSSPYFGQIKRSFQLQEVDFIRNP